MRSVWCVLVHGSRVISGGMDRKIRFWTRGGDCYATVDEAAKGKNTRKFDRPRSFLFLESVVLKRLVS